MIKTGGYKQSDSASLSHAGKGKQSASESGAYKHADEAPPSDTGIPKESSVDEGEFGFGCKGIAGYEQQSHRRVVLMESTSSEREKQPTKAPRNTKQDGLESDSREVPSDGRTWQSKGRAIRSKQRGEQPTTNPEEGENLHRRPVHSSSADSAAVSTGHVAGLPTPPPPPAPSQNGKGGAVSERAVMLRHEPADKHWRDEDEDDDAEKEDNDDEENGLHRTGGRSWFSRAARSEKMPSRGKPRGSVGGVVHAQRTDAAYELEVERSRVVTTRREHIPIPAWSPADRTRSVTLSGTKSSPARAYQPNLSTASPPAAEGGWKPSLRVARTPK